MAALSTSRTGRRDTGRRSIRVAGLLAGVAVLGASVSACSPPHEIDSMVKVDTAVESHVHSSVPGYIDCVGEPVIKPEIITLDCVRGSQELRSIEWTTWDEHKAEGIGVLTVANADGEIVGTQRMFSDVVLTDVRTTPQGSVFSSVVINGMRQEI